MKEIEPAIVLAKLDFMTDYLESLSSFESITLEEYLKDPVKVHQAIDIVLQKYPIYQRQITTYLDSLRDK